VILAYL